MPAICIQKQQKGHSGQECIHCLGPGLAAVYMPSLVGDSGQDYWISANGGVGQDEVGYTHPASIGLLHSACS